MNERDLLALMAAILHATRFDAINDDVTIARRILKWVEKTSNDA